jgi:tRNA-specific 2-thiouridylase
MRKTDVRASARRFGLPVAERPESQDICFGDYRSLVESYAAGEEIPGGDIVDRNGKVLGQHNGIHRVTVGQRRGLGVAASQPLYVLEIEEHSKRVVVGQRDQLYCSGLAAERVNWIEQPAATETEAEVQIRYRAPAIPCTVRLTENGCDVRFRQPCAAVTPGQAAVLYRGDRVLGGGWIASALKS